MNKENKNYNVTCPYCKKTFSLENAYTGAIDILNQKELDKRIDQAIKNKETEWKLAQEKEKNAIKDQHNKQVQELQNKMNEEAKKAQGFAIENKHLKDEYEKDKQIALSKLDANWKAKQDKTIQDYQQQVKQLDDQLKQAKEFKMKQSVKDLGESLEQFCLKEFNNLKAVGGFPTATLEKDNEISSESRSKGDFIFRDYANNQQYISIMFEMKNEQDVTKTKHKNSDFFKELDKDRKEKNCEYAVLVSCLEQDNETYNQGITDVSYISGYDKMYVVRPHCFITIISLLTNPAKKTIELQNQIQTYMKANIDVTGFEQKLNDWRTGFEKNAELCADHFKKAIDDIDKTIKYLTTTKEKLLKSTKQLWNANNKIQELSIRKLTYNNPTMKKAFDDARKK